MLRAMIRIHNAETNEVIDREMNDEELAQLNEGIADAEAQREAEAAKAAEKQAILDKLGITAEQAKLLLS